MIYYIYDGSYIGFLTAVFDCFDLKDKAVKVVTKEQYSPSFFDEGIEIISDSSKAKRVLNGLNKRLKKAQVNDFYCVFLSEDLQAVQYTFDLICELFRQGADILENYGDEKVIYFAQTLKSVGRERHRMKAFIRFKKATDGMYFAIIDPDFNVLPLIFRFFKNRYADQRWLIYDVKRNYGLMYTLQEVVEVKLLPLEKQALTTTEVIDFDEDEVYYQNLWKQYYQSTNIVARRNMKLHLQYVPKRYWKYLVEK